MAKADKKAAEMVAAVPIWTGKERIEAGKPLPADLTKEQVTRLKAKGAIQEETEAE